MAIPIYMHLKLDAFELEYILNKFRSRSIGRQPYFLEIDIIDPDILSDALANISQALTVLKINPLFPYPFYIVSSTKIRSHDLPIIASIQDLPQHFYKRSKILKPKEQSLFNKSSIVADKVKNLPVTKKLQQLREGYTPQRKLFEITNEAYFYDRILDRLYTFNHKGVSV